MHLSRAPSKRTAVPVCDKILYGEGIRLHYSIRLDHASALGVVDRHVDNESSKRLERIEGFSPPGSFQSLEIRYRSAGPRHEKRERGRCRIE